MNFLNFKKYPISTLLIQNAPPLVSQYAYKSTATAIFQYYTSIAILGAMSAYRKISNKLKGKKPKLIDYPKNTVILHQFPRAYYSPSLSPFAMKLETWCRAANINYANSFGMKLSSQGLIPFIKLNGLQVEDSQKCIEYLSDIFKKDLNAHLTEEQKAIQVAVSKMVEDSLFSCMALFRFWHSETGRKDTMLPLLAYWNFSYRVYSRSWNSGYGRHSKEYLFEIYCKNMKALDVLIGQKKYLLSDTQPSDVDFSIFGVCCQFKYNDKSPLNTFMITKCHNVVRHMENMQATYWPDWNENIGANRRPKKI